MDVKTTDGSVEVFLSASNLKDLAALWVASHHDMGLAYLNKTLDDGTTVRVVVESDTVHYKDRERGPGAKTVLSELLVDEYFDEFMMFLESENPF